MSDMSFDAVMPPGVPSPGGPYSHAVTWGDLIFVSGQGPIDPVSGTLLADDFAAEASQVLRNLRTVLSAAGGGFETVLKTQIYLVDLGNFRVMNELYSKSFDGPHFPARTTVQVAALPGGIGVEIDAVAFRRPS